MPIDNNTTVLLLIIWNWIEFYGNNVHVIDRPPCNSHNASVTAGSERLTRRLERTPAIQKVHRAEELSYMSSENVSHRKWSPELTTRTLHVRAPSELLYCSPISIHELQDFIGVGSALTKEIQEAVEYYIRTDLLIYRLHTILPRCTKLQRWWNRDKKWEINATLHTD